MNMVSKQNFNVLSLNRWLGLLSRKPQWQECTNCGLW